MKNIHYDAVETRIVLHLTATLDAATDANSRLVEQGVCRDV